MYVPMLTLICLSLGLQVIVGILSIVISNAKGYYESFRDEGNVCSNFLHLKIVCRDSNKTKVKKPKKPEVNKMTYQMFVKEDEDEDEEPPGCCPCYITTKVHRSYEYGVLAQHDENVQRLLDAEVGSVEHEEELLFLSKVVSDAKAEYARQEALAEDPNADKEAINAKLRQISDELAEAQKRKKEFEKNLKDAKILKGQCQAVQRYADAIVKNRVLKGVAFWQNGINYLLYAVFVINAFITGLGITGGPTSAAVSAANLSTQAG